MKPAFASAPSTTASFAASVSAVRSVKCSRTRMSRAVARNAARRELAGVAAELLHALEHVDQRFALQRRGRLPA